jgi:hypothetical protein
MSQIQNQNVKTVQAPIPAVKAPTEQAKTGGRV